MLKSLSPGRIDAASAGSVQVQTGAASSLEDIGEMRFRLEVAQSGALRQILYQAASSKFFGFAILLVIFLNTIVLALQSMHSATVGFGWFFAVFDHIFLGIYIMEAAMKLYTW
ncbi:MAG: hypothetical protein BJ554DRAFT_8091, partial [Olpidium bornovanus]